MDPLSLKVGNILTGNAADAAVIEVQTFPFKLRFTKTATFAVTGTDGRPLLDGKSCFLVRSYRQGRSDTELRQPPNSPAPMSRLRAGWTFRF